MGTENPGIIDIFTRMDSLLERQNELLEKLVNNTNPKFEEPVDEQLYTGTVQSILIDLSSPMVDHEFLVSGTDIYVVRPDTSPINVYIRLNSTQSDRLELTNTRHLHGQFNRFFITHAGLGGGPIPATLRLIISKGYSLQLGEGQSTVKEGEQFVSVTPGLAAWGTVVQGSIAVPLGHTYFIEGFSIQNTPGAAADYDHHMWVYGAITYNAQFLTISGDGGAILAFPRPLGYPAGGSLAWNVNSRANVGTLMSMNIWGFDVTN